MSENGAVAIETSDDALKGALIDHHLEEVAEMIERAQTEKPSSESPFSDIPAR